MVRDIFNIGEKVSGNVGLNEPLVNAILPAKDQDALWVGTDGGGLNYIDRKNKIVNVFAVKDVVGKRYSNIIKALALDNMGNILAGTLDGLAIFNPQTKALKYFNFNKDLNTSIRVNALLADKTGTWVGTEQGGLKFIKSDGSYTSFIKGGANTLSENYINTLVKENELLWIGTRNGLNCFNPITNSFASYYPRTENIASCVILSLCLDSKGRLWVGSSNGLFIFDKEKKQFFRIGDGNALTNQVIQAITEDSEGKIWVSTFNGLSKIDCKQVVQPYSINSYQITNYTANDGLASNQFSLGAVARKGGEIYFGGVNGITSFFPQRLVKNHHQPKVVITDLMINSKSVKPNTAQSPLQEPIETTGKIVLNYDQNFIAFKFAALSFLNTQNNQYAYKLNGLKSHEGWHYVGTQRTANYTNLEPGKYVFELKAANNDGIWSANTTDIEITVLPPFWRTWWAYVIYILLFTLAIYIIIRVIRVRAKLERDLFYEHFENSRQQELNQMKLDFFTNISHELRTPLTLIVGPLENLLKDTPAVGSGYEQLQLIKNNSDRLLKLVSELLDFRKTETGNMNIYASSQNLVSFLWTIFHSFQHMAVASNVDYKFITEADDIVVYFDDNQLEKVIYNLLANAFKFTPAGGKIELKVIKLPDSVQISIADNGKGIPYDKQENLFKNFYQVEEPGLRNTGSGIGLALSKNIVDLHKGIINVMSVPNSENNEPTTCFTISLKLGNAHFEENQLLPQSIQHEAHDYPIISTQFPTLSNIEQSTTNDLKKYTIQIVEDNDELRSFLRSSIEQNYLIHESINGLQGWETAVELIPDIIISDVMMPEMDGLEFTLKIKSDIRTSHIPVILLTARSTQQQQISGLENGADIYLTKPFSIQMLELHIHNLIESRQILQRKYSQKVTLEPQHTDITQPDQKFLSKVMSIIEENIANENFGVPFLSTEIGMSQPVLYKKLKALTDLSVNDFIKSIRLKKAAQLLQQKQFTVYEVAYAVGFSDSKYFSKEFAKYHGVLPSVYKASH
ncbi:MAG: hybrid sensor histidine kinase/response regulator [Sphingobacteriaceae bacterium]|nr:MAG: hybrid sensor histidine kinase/response regulator [Sphingobacteriaceae bacterium]